MRSRASSAARTSPGVHLPSPASFSVPARNAPLSETDVRAWKARHREIRAVMRTVRSGALLEFNDKSALAVSEDERLAEYRAAGWSRFDETAAPDRSTVI